MLHSVTADAQNPLTEERVERALLELFQDLGPRRRVLLVPPDFSRLSSGAGALTLAAFRHYRDAVKAVIPALGTHRPMTAEERRIMFPGIPDALFLAHDWRTGVRRVGSLPADRVAEASAGAVNHAIEVALNRDLLQGGFDLVLSIGRVVPHEVAGMANHAKNLLVGLGGSDFIHRTHYLGAVCGMERIMGRADNPVRRLLDQAADAFLRGLPVIYLLSVTGRDGVLAGLFAGDNRSCFDQAAALSRRLNISRLERPLERCVVYLDPAEYASTWLGNKAVYRTRLALADGGQLLIMAPGLRRFGEDAAIDRLIRRHGYRGTAATLTAVRKDPELAANLAAAAHLIHGSDEGRFGISYASGELSRSELTGVGYGWRDLDGLMARYEPRGRSEGMYRDADGEYLFIPDPGVGLWAWAERMDA